MIKEFISMQEYFIELSKYVITVLVVLYTVCSLSAFRYRSMSQKKGIYVIQVVLMFATQLVSFLNLEFESGDVQYFFLYAFVQIFLFATVTLVNLIYEKPNRLLLNNMCMLLGMGMCILSRLSIKEATKQYIIVMISLTISLTIPFLLSHIHFLKKLTWIYAATGILLLGIVLVMGQVSHGSKLYYTFKVFGGITIQPSEFVKIIFLFFLAGALWKEVSVQRVALTAVLAGMHVIILVLSRDLGSALIFFVGYVLVVFVASRNYLYLMLGVAGGCAAALAAYRLFDHVQTRVLAWRDPWSYIDNQGYQITQSLFAVGSGSWFGMGLLKGNPKAIPYVESDFIFSAICEEMGLIVGICLLLICVSSFLAIMEIAIEIHDRFYQLIVFGIGVVYIFQIFLTVGGGTKFIPLTGVTLPFVSYGGSSIMTNMFMFFIIQGIYMRLQQEGGQNNISPRKTFEQSPENMNQEDRNKKVMQKGDDGLVWEEIE